jgi:hypothetical protein
VWHIPLTELLSPCPPPHSIVCVLTTMLDIYRNAIGSFHNVRLARSRGEGWSVVSRPGMSYLSHGLNLYRKARHVLLAGEAVTLDHTGYSVSADPNTYFRTNPIPLPSRRKKKVRERSILHHLRAVALTLCGSFFAILQKCTAERPSCKLCKSTGTENDCVYEPTWRVLSAADIESISRRTSTTPVSCSEDGGSSLTDEYDHLSWTGDCPGDPAYPSPGSERQNVDPSLCQDTYPIVPHQGYPAPVPIGERKQDG